ncbi:beta-lactamase [Nannochloropsis oceanica]
MRLRFLTTGALSLAWLGIAMGIGTMSPEDARLDRKRLEKITQELQTQVSRNQLPGAAFQVYRAGKLVFQDAVGFQDRELMRPMGMGTIVRLMSQTKPLTAAGVMILIERGLLKLDDPLWKYHPRFRNMRVLKYDGATETVPADRDITINDLLLHTAGFGYSGGFNDPTGDGPWQTLELPFESLEFFMDDLADKPLFWQPGTTWRYSWSYDVLGYVIKRITNQSPDDWLRQNLFVPLQMYDTDFYVPMSKIDRFAVAYTMTRGNVLIPFIRPRMDPLQAFSPPTFLSCGSGIVSTLHDYSRFALMLLNGGEIDGIRILQSSTVDMMWRNNLNLALLPMDLNGWKSDMNTGWGYGFTVSAPGPLPGVDWSKHTGANKTGSIGWGGGMMTNWIASADNDLLVVFATQRLATPIPNTFQEIVVEGVMKSIKGNSPRKLPGPEGPAVDYEVDDGTNHAGGSGGNNRGFGLGRAARNPLPGLWGNQWVQTDQMELLESLTQEQAERSETYQAVEKDVVGTKTTTRFRNNA